QHQAVWRGDELWLAVVDRPLLCRQCGPKGADARHEALVRQRCPLVLSRQVRHGRRDERTASGFPPEGPPARITDLTPLSDSLSGIADFPPQFQSYQVSEGSEPSLAP